LDAAAAAAANSAATAELSRLFDKADFAVMQPLGQFNLGFIIARLQQDLFIVDQHAAGMQGSNPYAYIVGSLLHLFRTSCDTAMQQACKRLEVCLHARCLPLDMPVAAHLSSKR
jgi:hypothetical protein